MLESVLRATSSVRAVWLKVWGGKPYSPVAYRHFVDFQLRTQRYLPCKPGLGGNKYGRPTEIYWPNAGLAGVTPILDLQGVPDHRRRALRSLFVEKLGIRDRLPSEWTPWLNWAANLAAVVVAGAPPPERIIRRLYETLCARTFSTERPPAVALSIVCQTATGLKAVAARDAAWIDDPALAASDVVSWLIEAGLAVFPPMLNAGVSSVERLGVTRASSIVEVSATYVQPAPSQTAKLQSRLKGRRRALALICSLRQQPWREPPEFEVVQGLQLHMSFGDQSVVKPTLAFRTQDRWLISAEGDMNEALAGICADTFAHPAEWRHRFATLLRVARDQIGTVLMQDGIPLYQLAEFRLDSGRSDERDDDEGYLDTTSSQNDGTSHSASQEAVDDESESENLGLVDDEVEEEPGDGDVGVSSEAETSGADGGSGQAGSTGRRPGKLRSRKLLDGERKDRKPRARSEAAARATVRGQEAEDWLCETLRPLLSKDWSLHRNVRDDKNRESDIVLSSPKSEWHLEVKSLATERIYWSELERSKAEGLSGRYFMALVTGGKEAGFQIHWSWDPLADLIEFERRLDWVWTYRHDGPLLQPGSWTIPGGISSPLRPADSVQHVVTVKQEHLDACDRDNQDLTLLLQKIGASVLEPAAV